MLRDHFKLIFIVLITSSVLSQEQEQKYLFKQVRQQKFYNVTGTNKVQLDSLGMVSNYMFYFQRSYANLRNEWSNYSNWPYDYLPSDLKNPLN